MLKLKVISLFLSLLIALQMLPILKIGKALANNQWTEELPHDVDENGKENSVRFNPSFLPPAAYITSDSCLSEVKALAYIQLSDQIPTNHSVDIVTPPPDFSV